MKKLESQGINIHLYNYYKENAYLIGVLYGEIRILKYLEKRQINKNLKNDINQNCFNIYIMYNHYNTKIYLYKNREWKLNIFKMTFFYFVLSRN
jgi:hypothetical protein